MSALEESYQRNISVTVATRLVLDMMQLHGAIGNKNVNSSVDLYILRKVGNVAVMSTALGVNSYEEIQSKYENILNDFD